MRGPKTRQGLTAASAVLVGVIAAGCQHGEVKERSQHQEVRDDGTAVQVRTQTRQTPSGATVKETQTQERQVIQPGSSNTTDATKKDPGN
jgi:hypothetical protein